MVDVNRVYQKVQAIANKEQRGYITPQEFNLFADYAQLGIFEQYFYDLDQRQAAIGNETDYSDIVSNLEEKISLFEIYNTNINSTDLTLSVDSAGNNINIYRLGSVKVIYLTDSNYKIADRMKLNEMYKYQNSPLAAPKKSKPVYTEFSTEEAPINIDIQPSEDIDEVIIDYIKKPPPPRWTYIISSTGNALYDENTNTKHFELHSSEENNLIVKILQLAGVSLKDIALIQAASQEQASIQ